VLKKYDPIDQKKDQNFCLDTYDANNEIDFLNEKECVFAIPMEICIHNDRKPLSIAVKKSTYKKPRHWHLTTMGRYKN